jgi:2-deoxy-D-gluconate 3-dehydrogenase
MIREVKIMNITANNQLLNLKDKVAIVTGGATGIGLAICGRLGEAGAAVIIADVTDEKAHNAVQELIKTGCKASFIHCDVSNEEDVRILAGSVMKDYGRIDILVNNAGIYPYKPLAETGADLFGKVLSINLTGAFLCGREVSVQMISKGQGGRIINIASIDALHPSSSGMAAYDASKGGLVSLTKSMALELGKHDIRVNAVAPGGIMTEGVRASMTAGPTTEGRSQLKRFLSHTALGQMGRPDDVARVVLFLASDMASYITGSIIVVDGGYLIS